MEIEDQQTPMKAIFDHPKNITFGVARVIYAEAVTALDNTRGLTLPAGWVLPGGRRTGEREHAYEVAAAIDRLTRTNGA